MDHHWTRRSLLSAALLAAALPAATKAVSAGHPPLGIQLWMVKDALTADPAATLRAIATAGFGAVELAGWPAGDRTAFAAMLADAGLVCRCAHLPVLLASDDEIGPLLDEAAGFGLTHVFAPIPGFAGALDLPQSERGGALFARTLSADDWRWNAERLNRIADKATAHGLTIGYHNHNIEFAPLDGTTPYAMLLAGTDSGRVVFELDVGHVILAGADPFALLADYPDRFRAAHLKQWRRPFTPRTKLDLPPSADFGAGFDWPRWLAAARGAGIVHLFAERDNLAPAEQLPATVQAGRYFAGLER